MNVCYYITCRFHSESALCSLPECQETPCSKQALYLKFRWRQQNSNLQPLSSQTNTQPFSQTGPNTIYGSWLRKEIWKLDKWPHFFIYFLHSTCLWNSFLNLKKTQNSCPAFGPFWPVKYLNFWPEATNLDSSSYFSRK